MSDSLLRVIPTDPDLVPTVEAGLEALRAMEQLAPDADHVSISSVEKVQFIDAGGNFESVHCPSCRSSLGLDWWGSVMDDAAAARFTELDVQLPCCGAASNLNDLDYSFPQGFARWLVQVRNPGRGPISDAEAEAVRNALGHDVRFIWTRI